MTIVDCHGSHTKVVSDVPSRDATNYFRFFGSKSVLFYFVLFSEDAYGLDAPLNKYAKTAAND